jgi:hypothetical protein
MRGLLIRNVRVLDGHAADCEGGLSVQQRELPGGALRVTHGLMQGPRYLHAGLAQSMPGAW